MNIDKLLKHVTPKRALDIGAHVGTFTKELYYRNPECKTIMVEANKECEPALRLLSKPYDLIALSDVRGILYFYIEKNNPIATGASLYKENTEWYAEGKYKTITVEADTLDNRNYFDGQPIDLIKIDVQGAELDILKGGEKTIQNASYVILEMSLSQYNQGAPLIGEVVDKMVEYGFCIVDILEYHSFPHLYGGAIFQIDALFKKL